MMADDDAVDNVSDYDIVVALIALSCFCPHNHFITLAAVLQVWVVNICCSL